MSPMHLRRVILPIVLLCAISGCITITPPLPPVSTSSDVHESSGTTGPAEAEATPPPALSAADSTPGSIEEGSAPAASCRFTSTGDGPMATWHWLRDPAYEAYGQWKCTGVPASSDLPITLVALVTNGPDGGSGYSAPAVLTVDSPETGAASTMQIYLQNPLPEQSPLYSHGAGYLTTGYAVIPATYAGAGGTLQFFLSRLPGNPQHVGVNAETLHFDPPRPAATFAARGDLIQGWAWLRDPQRTDYGEWRFTGLDSTLPAILVMELLVTDAASGGAGYSAAVQVSVRGPDGEVVTQTHHVRAQNALLEEDPGDRSGRGYRAFASLWLDPEQIPASGELVVRLAQGDERPIAVNTESVKVVQPGAGESNAEGVSPTPGFHHEMTPTPELPIEMTPTPEPPGEMTPTLEPPVEVTLTPEARQDQATCEAQGGRWGRIGLGLREECNLPTSDGGASCTDSDQCDSLCLADLSQEEYDQVVRDHTPVPTSGRCAEWRIVVGCVAPLENGAVSGVLCID